MKKFFTLLVTISIIPFLSEAQNVGVDVATPQQKLDVDGGIKIGNTANGVAGSLRWDGTNIQYHDGTSWINLVANTDDQNLTLALNILSIEDGNTVDLSPYLDNTDAQTLSLSGENLTISTGNTVDLGPLQRQLVDADSDTKVQVEESADEDIIRFDLAGNERWVMQGSRLENAGTGSSVFIGENAGTNDDLSARHNTAVGADALTANSSGVRNTALGADVLTNSTGNFNTGAGSRTLEDLSTGNRNAAFGVSAGQSLTSGSENVLLGNSSGVSIETGSNNTLVGHNAGFNAGTAGTGNVFIGHRAGYNETGDNKLYIDNSDIASPLIQGDFSANTLQFNGSVNVGGNYTLPTADGAAAGYVMSTDAAGTVSWVDPGLTGDITAVNAGDGLVGGGTSGDVTLDINPDNSTVEVAADVLRVKAEGITTNEIATDGVDADEIAANAVGLSEIATGGVASDEIVDNSIDAIDINTGAVTTDEILNATILPEDVDPTAGTDQQVLSIVGGVATWSDPGAVTPAIQDDDGDTKIEVEASADEDFIRMSTQGAEELTINPAGNVGIGITDPTRPVHVAGTSGGQILVSRDDATVTVGETLGEILFDAEDDNASSVDASAVIRGVSAEPTSYGNSDKGGELQFLTKTNATDENAAATERMSIEQNGDVRIGASASSGNDLYINDRLIDWDNSSYYVDPASASVMNEIHGDGGSASDPPFTFLGDDNTGMFRASNNHLGFSTGGTERVRIIDNGNVGVGTSIPNEKLHVVGDVRVISTSDVNGSTASGGFRIESGGNTLNLDGNEIQSNGDNLYIQNEGLTDLVVGGSSANDLYVDVSAGRTGFGTNAPAQKIHVIGTGRFSSLAGTGTRMVAANASGDLVDGGNFGSIVAVNNGLNYNVGADAIRLGGTLIQTTTVAQGAYNMVFNMNSSGDFHIQDNGVNHFSVVDNGDSYFGSDVYFRDGSTGGTILGRFIDSGDDGVFDVYRNGAIHHRIHANGGTYFNEQSADQDFRIESDAYANMFKLDAGLNRIGLNESAPKTMLHIADPAGQTLMLERADGTTTSGEQLGGIGFDSGDGNTPDDVREASASILAFATESHGTGDKGGRLEFWTSPTNQNDDTDGILRMRIDQNGVIYAYNNLNMTDDDILDADLGEFNTLADGDGGSQIEVIDDFDLNDRDIWDVQELTVNTIDDTDGTNLVHIDQTRLRVDVGSSRDVWFETYASEPLIRPGTANWGYLGKFNNYWYYLYSNNIINVSQRSTKRDINPLDENKSAEALILNDIDKLRPSLYKYKAETDNVVAGLETKYRPQYHLGFILDETPDYLQDNMFSGIDVYALSSMSLVGVKDNRERIKALEEGRGRTKINDFGSSTMDGEIMWVQFDPEFSGQLSDGQVPVVTVTPNALGAEVAVIEKTSTGFKVRKVGTNPLSFDWVAFAKVSKGNVDPNGAPSSVDPAILEQLRLSPAAKAQSQRIVAADRQVQEMLNSSSEDKVDLHEEVLEDYVSPSDYKIDDERTSPSQENNGKESIESQGAQDTDMVKPNSGMPAKSAPVNSSKGNPRN